MSAQQTAPARAALQAKAQARRERIVALCRHTRHPSTLARVLGVSTKTMRRDLALLEAEGKVRRCSYYGDTTRTWWRAA